MAEGVVETPAAPGGSGQGGGQGDGGGGGYLPGQGPAGGGKPAGQPAPGQGQPSPEYVPKSQYDELRSSTDRRYNELSATLKQLQGQFQQRQPAPSNGGQPAAQGGTLGKLTAALGLDEAGGKLLESFLEEKYGPVNERAQWLQDQVERQEFFSQYPSFRQHEAKILEIDKKLESGEMSVMNLKAMAFIGMNAQEIINNAVASAKKEWEATERKKLSVASGGGSGARPGATVEERVGASKGAFNVDKPTFTNKPQDD